MRPHTYEITFAGRACAAVRAEFDDCAVTAGPDTTTLHAELPDQAALCGLMLRITGLGLQVVHLQLMGPSRAPSPVTSTPAPGPATRPP